MRKFIITAALLGSSLFSPAIANADFSSEMKAGDRVEISVMNRGYRSFNPTSFCDQQSRSKYYCSISGYRGDCFLSGKAYVRNPGWRVQILTLRKSCFQAKSNAVATLSAVKAPNVRCRQLDLAERTLRRRGFRIVEHGGGMFGIVVKASWVVVHQRQSGRTVHLTAGRSC